LIVPDTFLHCFDVEDMAVVGNPLRLLTDDTTKVALPSEPSGMTCV